MNGRHAQAFCLYVNTLVMVSKLVDQTFVSANAIIGAGLLAIIAAFIGYVWPRVKDQVDQNKQKIYDELGRRYADMARDLLSEDSARSGKKTKEMRGADKDTENLAGFVAKSLRQGVESVPIILSAERPLTALREAVFALLLASLSFLASVGLALSTYESWSGITSVIGGLFLVYFLYRVAVLWHDLSK